MLQPGVSLASFAKERRCPPRDCRCVRFVRPRATGLLQHVIARSLKLAQRTVSKYFAVVRRAGISWPLPPELDDDARLEALSFPPPPNVPADQRPQPDWAVVHRELHQSGVTFTLLWQEYRDGASDRFSYSWSYDLYRAWVDR